MIKFLSFFSLKMRSKRGESMPPAPNTNELFLGFSKLSREERFKRLISLGAMTSEDISFLKNGGIKDLNLAEKLIENVVGYFQLPLGVATNFNVNGRDYVIPMAVEETSIIAALSKSAKWIRQCGEIKTWVEGDCILGQIQLAKIKNFSKFSTLFAEYKKHLIDKANQDVAATMVKRGGGVIDLQLRHLKREDDMDMAVIHLTMNSCDAMGANIINQVLEYLKSPIEELTGEEVTMCILSNLNDQKLTTAQVTISTIDPILGQKLQEASLFAEMDSYRAATHNKGVMNGIDPVLIATGNDWRAVEAGVHAYAARNGRYQAITHWRYQNGILTGRLTAPIIVGTIGGVTSLHPTAKMCLRMMNITSANELSQVIAAVGLVQNLGAIKALCTEGIIQGHMKLHIDNLLLAAGAKETEIPELKERLQNWLNLNKRISLNNAHDLLAEIRQAPIAV
jgi:hydroxymethylglutaryl-CoA reductase